MKRQKPVGAGFLAGFQQWTILIAIFGYLGHPDARQCFCIPKKWKPSQPPQRCAVNMLSYFCGLASLFSRKNGGVVKKVSSLFRRAGTVFLR
jgi:hypothetical protein